MPDMKMRQYRTFTHHPSLNAVGSSCREMVLIVHKPYSVVYLACSLLFNRPGQINIYRVQKPIILISERKNQIHLSTAPFWPSMRLHLMNEKEVTTGDATAMVPVPWTICRGTYNGMNVSPSYRRNEDFCRKGKMRRVNAFIDVIRRWPQVNAVY